MSFTIKQLIGCWTGKVHTGEISRRSWSWGRWGARMGLHLSGFLGSAFLCVGLTPRLAAFKLETCQSAVPGLHAFSSHCGGEDSFLSPNHPAECWALLWLDGQPTPGHWHGTQLGMWPTHPATVEEWLSGRQLGWQSNRSMWKTQDSREAHHAVLRSPSVIPTFDIIFVSFSPCIKEVTWLAPLRSPLSYYTLVIIASTHLLSTSYVCAGFVLSTYIN